MFNILSCPSPFDKLEPLFSLIVDIIDILKIAVPIILIVYGMIDFGKAVVGKDEAEIKKSQMMFVRRAIYAVAVFFVITLVTLIMNMIANYVHDNTDVNAESWIDCFGFGGSSSKNYSKENNSSSKYYTVNFKTDGNGRLSGNTIYQVKKGSIFKDTIIVPSVIEENGYIFYKWEPEIPDYNSSINKNVSYKALFSKDENNNHIADDAEKKYKVVFKSGTHGEINGTKEFRVLTGLKFSDNVIVPTVIANKGYTFSGFDNELPSDDYIIDKDLTFVAQYIKN